MLNRTTLWLNIDAEKTHFSLSALNGIDEIVLHIGNKQIAKEFFKHKAPMPIEVEAAIEQIEDEIMRVHSDIETSITLATKDGWIANVAELAGLKLSSNPLELSTEKIEVVFNRFADIASGSPAKQHEMILKEPENAAYLLILRELMHHLGLTKVMLYKTS